VNLLSAFFIFYFFIKSCAGISKTGRHQGPCLRFNIQVQIQNPLYCGAMLWKHVLVALTLC